MTADFPDVQLVGLTTFVAVCPSLIDEWP